SIDEQDADAISTSLEGMRQAGKDNKSIRTTVMNHYRDLYKTAYIENDIETMDAIKYGMLYLDLGEYSFTDDDTDPKSIFNSWKKDADKNN
ncbi:MAG: hypothetical protein ILP14_03395, partial [Oscillospiraceae bacterium]|nr:hypothetical protein [Oscillospiraceae bacterium]